MDYYTSDSHLGGLLPNRNFKSKEHFIQRFITGTNQRVKPNDRLFIVGDFVSYGRVAYTDYSGKKVVADNLRNKAPYYLDLITSKNVVIIEGNHDYNNGTKPQSKFSFNDVGQYLAFVSHYPTYSNSNPLLYPHGKWAEIVKSASLIADFAIVGHVHDAPKAKWDTKNGIVNLNVAVDVRNWMPVSAEELIIEYRNFIKKA